MLRLSRTKIIYEFFKRENVKKQQLFFIVDFYTHYKRIGYNVIIIPKPHFSSHQGIYCRRFDVLLFAVLPQFVAVEVVAVPTGWLAINHDRSCPRSGYFIPAGGWQSTVTTVTGVAGSFNGTVARATQFPR